MSFVCFAGSCLLQNKHSVQFNYLFKKAWEEDIIEGSNGNGEIMPLLVSKRGVLCLCREILLFHKKIAIC